MRVAYVRVSTVEQNEARQVEALKVHDIEKMVYRKSISKGHEQTEVERNVRICQRR